MMLNMGSYYIKDLQSHMENILTILSKMPINVIWNVREEQLLEVENFKINN